MACLSTLHILKKAKKSNHKTFLNKMSIQSISSLVIKQGEVLKK